MGIRELLSRHLISYARDEKWLHDLMDGKKDRSQLYKKAMKHYIATAGDPEFRNVTIEGNYTPQTPYKVNDTALYNNEVVKITATSDYKELDDKYSMDIKVDSDEIMGIMNMGGTK